MNNDIENNIENTNSKPNEINQTNFDFDYNLQQRKGFFGPIMCMPFVFILGVFWFLYRLYMNNNIDTKINTTIARTTNLDTKKMYMQNFAAKKEQCLKQTVKGIIGAAIIIIIIVVIVFASAIVPFVLIAKK